jgi:SAM-dependent methyltransferase
MPSSFPASRRAQSEWPWPPAPVPTGMGMSPRLDPLTHRFAMWAGRRYGTTCADVGCGAGIATAAALVRGARVIAIDPDTNSIQPLLVQLPVQQYARIDVRRGQLPQLSLPAAASLTSIHVARVFHLLDGAAIRESLQRFSDHLRKDGKLFISVLTPGGEYWSHFRQEYARRCAVNETWPGAADSRRPHLIDEHVLGRELTLAGFGIEESLTFPLAWDPSQICCGIVAIPHVC